MDIFVPKVELFYVKGLNRHCYTLWSLLFGFKLDCSYCCSKAKQGKSVVIFRDSIFSLKVFTSCPLKKCNNEKKNRKI